MPTLVGFTSLCLLHFYNRSTSSHAQPLSPTPTHTPTHMHIYTHTRCHSIFTQSTLPTLPAHKQPLEQLQQRASTQPPSPHDAKQLLEELRTAAAIEVCRIVCRIVCRVVCRVVCCMHGWVGGWVLWCICLCKDICVYVQRYMCVCAKIHVCMCKDTYVYTFLYIHAPIHVPFVFLITTPGCHPPRPSTLPTNKQPLHHPPLCPRSPHRPHHHGTGALGRGPLEPTGPPCAGAACAGVLDRL